MNEIKCTKVNELNLSEVKEIKFEIFEHYKDRFRLTNALRPQFHLSKFNQIGEYDNKRLIAKFTEVPIKREV